MGRETDVAYFTRRASEEKAMSRTAANPKAAQVHAQLAWRYEWQLARMGPAGLPRDR